MIRLWVLCIGLMCVLSTKGVAEQRYFEGRLSADSVQSSQNQMTAEGHVLFSSKEFDLKTGILTLDTAKNRLWASGNVDLIFQDRHWNPSSLYIDLNTKHVTLKNLDLIMTPDAGKAPVYARLGECMVSGNSQFGKDLVLTTCLQDPPHYTVSSKTFEYYPDRYILAKDVHIRHDIFGVPLDVYLPYYRYELGKRNLIWRVPIIGRKETAGWGWFIQNTIDYAGEEGRFSSIFLDAFQGKGFGLGFSHQFEENGHRGTVNYYRLDELDSGKLNEKYGFLDGFQWSKNVGVTVNYQKIKAERINSSGFQDNEVKGADVLYKEGKESYAISAKDNQDVNQKVRQTAVSVQHGVDGVGDYRLFLQQRDNDAALRKDLDMSFVHKLILDKDTQLDSQFYFNRQKLFLKPQDERLETKLSAVKTLDKSLQVALKIDHLADLDHNQISTNNALNRYFFRLPELTLSYTPDFFPFSFSQTFTMARYQEVELQNQQGLMRTFPKDQDMSLAPNTYIYSQRASQTFSNGQPYNSFTLSTGYSQYIFQTPGKTLLDGDAMYTLDLTARHSLEVIKGWNAETGYSTVYAPKENNSPFFYFNDKILSQNLITEKWIFYWENPSLYQWSHEAGYDWVSGRWQDYRTQVQLRPKPWEFTINTGKKLSPSSFDVGQDFYPFVMSAGYAKPEEKSRFTFAIAFDTNKWIYTNQTVVQSSQLAVSTWLGSGDPDKQWEASVALIYQNPNQTAGFSPDRYAVQTFQLTKHDHCRSFTLGYNKLTEEISFRYTIDAFPDDALVVIKNPEGVRLGGQLNMTSQERF
jgi:hypothetical protein